MPDTLRISWGPLATTRRKSWRRFRARGSSGWARRLEWALPAPRWSPAEEAAAGGTAIASESEVAPGSAVKFKDSGKPAVLVHLDNGDFVAYSAVCTHQGCDVAYQGGELACPCHGSVFDPADGAAVVTGPATRPLPEIPIKVQGGEVVRA